MVISPEGDPEIAKMMDRKAWKKIHENEKDKDPDPEEMSIEELERAMMEEERRRKEEERERRAREHKNLTNSFFGPKTENEKER